MVPIKLSICCGLSRETTDIYVMINNILYIGPCVRPLYFPDAVSKVVLVDGTEFLSSEYENQITARIENTVKRVV